MTSKTNSDNKGIISEQKLYVVRWCPAIRLQCT